jgi:hypothetical protein
MQVFLAVTDRGELLHPSFDIENAKRMAGSEGHVEQYETVEEALEKHGEPLAKHRGFIEQALDRDPTLENVFRKYRQNSR